MDVVWPKPGKYVIAVSGGVDSMALLDMLSKRAGLELVVAHLDHGIRSDSEEDRRLVEAVADTLRVPFVYQQARLGPETSEATAREVRYEFLNKTNKDYSGDGIITAHHQDDVLETAIVNLLRGTGRKGMTSLGDRPGVIRPLVNVPKAEVVKYAQTNGLRWREDSTNSDETYLRNYVRHRLLPKFDARARAEMLGSISKLRGTNKELDQLLIKQLEANEVAGKLNRRWLTGLPHDAGREVLATWLRSQGINFDRPTLERLVVAAKTGVAGKRFPIPGGHQLAVGKETLALQRRER